MMRFTSQGGACACHAHCFSVAQRLLHRQLACAFHIHMRLHERLQDRAPFFPLQKYAREMCLKNVRAQKNETLEERH